MSLENWMEEQEVTQEGAKKAFRDWLERNQEDFVPYLLGAVKEGVKEAMTEWLELHHLEVLKAINNNTPARPGR